MIKIQTEYEAITNKAQRAFRKWAKTHDGQPLTTAPQIWHDWCDNPITIAEQAKVAASNVRWA